MIEKHIDSYLKLLRDLIRGRGFTQLEVQDVLGWGRSYISQLLTKQKALRFDQVLLSVIGVTPDAFFARLYHLPTSRRSPERRRPPGGPTTDHRPLPDRSSSPDGWSADATGPRAGLRRLQALLGGLVSLLKKKGIITAAELAHAIEKAKHES